MGNALPWREFETLLGGLLACDSRLYRQFYKPERPDKPADADGGDW